MGKLILCITSLRHVSNQQLLFSGASYCGEVDAGGVCTYLIGIKILLYRAIWGSVGSYFISFGSNGVVI